MSKMEEKFQTRVHAANLVIAFSERARREGRMEEADRINTLIREMGRSMGLFLKRRRKWWYEIVRPNP
jgi:hypothetical protein